MRETKIKILHITPHLGGGVGRVLLNYLGHMKNGLSLVNAVSCLDYANEQALDRAGKIGLVLNDRMSGKKNQLLEMISKADIVLIHWWNHPLLYDFLVRTPLPPCRVVMWSHISGFHPPSVFTEKILRYPDLFVFTTPVSYEAKDVQKLPAQIKNKLRVVWATGGIEHVKDVRPKEHNGFNVGYIGTVDYCKLHPEFLEMCSKVAIPDVKFVVCGGPKEKEIKQEAEILGIGEEFSFVGQVGDITQYLSIFDVFGYPLAPYHYGTCDQVLAESMACGVVPVVFSNRMETQMVKDGVTGLVVNNKEEYVNAIKQLYLNKELKARLSANAREYSRKVFSIEVMKNEWGRVFEEMLMFPKTSKRWEIVRSNKAITASDVFLDSLGEYGKDFASYCGAANMREKETSARTLAKLAKSPVWQAQTRGTVHHYHEFFPEDERLAVWSRLMKEYETSKKTEPT